MPATGKPIAISAAAAALLAACAPGPSGPGDASFLSASIASDVQSNYQGSGTFRLLPAGLPGPRFSLHSHGTGRSSNQGFTFLAMESIAVGEHPVGELDAATYHVNYRYDEGDTRKIFEARSGRVRIGEASAGRVAGGFELSAVLVLSCLVESGFPGSILTCEPAVGDEELEISGSFAAGPLGGS